MEDSIIVDLKDSYGITCHHITPVIGGLLNRKWKIATDKGDLLVKQFSMKRFNLRQLKLIESALQRQILLEKKGVSCPYIWQYADHAIRMLDNETAYVVMDFHSGKIESPNTITIMQMHSLGSACGLMHKAFSQLPTHSVKDLPVYGGYTLDLLWENFNSRMKECSPDAHVEYRKALLALEPILKQLRADYFDKFPKAFAHEDIQPGNILFYTDCISAIIDFDRNCYSYIWHDVGRAILSFALEDNRINIEKTHAFIEGYSQHLTLTLPNVVDALRLSWCIETPWWIQPEFFQENSKTVVRFKDEMLWLTEHWFELDSLVCSGGDI